MLSSFTSTNLVEGDSFLAVEHEVGNLPFLFQGCGGIRFFFVKVGVSSIFSSWAYSFFHLLKRQKGIVRIFFPYIEQGGFLPTEG